MGKGKGKGFSKILTKEKLNQAENIIDNIFEKIKDTNPKLFELYNTIDTKSFVNEVHEYSIDNNVSIEKAALDTIKKYIKLKESGK